jgi:aldose 1-epimerase
MPSNPEPEQLRLQHGNDQLVLDPRHGGAIREYTSGGRPVLRPSGQQAGSDPFDLACFPLVSYANRIAHGRFTAGGRTVQLAPNWDKDSHPLHGQGWRRPWQVMHASPTEALLAFLGGGDDWPWRYRAEQRFQLGFQGLLVRLTVENLSSEPMPAMLGLHPYFPDAASAWLTARTPRVWMADEGALPVTEVPTPGTWSFEGGRPVAAQALDHCFAGWDGAAVLRWPGRSLTLRATHCHHLHVYAPLGGDFFCVEPQTAAAGALGREGEELALLEPGARLAMDMTLSCGGA